MASPKLTEAKERRKAIARGVKISEVFIKERFYAEGIDKLKIEKADLKSTILNSKIDLEQGSLRNNPAIKAKLANAKIRLIVVEEEIKKIEEENENKNKK